MRQDGRGGRRVATRQLYGYWALLPWALLCAGAAPGQDRARERGPVRAPAQEPKAAEARVNRPSTQPQPRVRQVMPKPPPPGMGRAGRVEGAGARHGRDPDLFVAVLAPQRRDFPALTTRPQPSLFWFLSKPTDKPVRLTLAPVDAEAPLWRETVRVQGSGIQRLDLSRLKAKAGEPPRLEPGVQYKFSVSALADERNPANNPFASATVERVEPPAGLAEEAAEKTPKGERAALYGEAGIWWDMLAEVDDYIAASPRDATLRQWRADLLRAQDDPKAEPGKGILHRVAEAEDEAR